VSACDYTPISRCLDLEIENVKFCWEQEKWHMAYRIVFGQVETILQDLHKKVNEKSVGFLD